MAVLSEFDLEWERLKATLAVVERHAATREERTKVLAIKRALEGDDFVGALCHDLKDPLSAITMGASLLKKQLPEDRALHAVVSAARRLDRVVQNARDLEMLRAGKYTPQTREVLIASLLLPNVERVREAARAKGVTIAFEGGDARAIVDAHAMGRAFDEILDNSIGFSAEGGTVRVRVERGSVVVEDDGPGIDAAHLPYVFDESKNRAHKPRRGAGRGLPLAREYALVQGGELEVTSAGAGVRAILTLRTAT
jgi:signal transduction histidine kinase